MRAYWLVPLLLAAALGIAAADRESGLGAWLGLRDELRSSRETLADLERENEALRNQVGALESDAFALERAIREDLGLGRPGEVLVHFGEAAQGPGAELTNPRFP